MDLIVAATITAIGAVAAAIASSWGLVKSARAEKAAQAASAHLQGNGMGTHTEMLEATTRMVRDISEGQQWMGGAFDRLSSQVDALQSWTEHHAKNHQAIERSAS